MNPLKTLTRYLPRIDRGRLSSLTGQNPKELLRRVEDPYGGDGVAERRPGERVEGELGYAQYGEKQQYLQGIEKKRLEKIFFAPFVYSAVSSVDLPSFRPPVMDAIAHETTLCIAVEDYSTRAFAA